MLFCKQKQELLSKVPLFSSEVSSFEIYWQQQKNNYRIFYFSKFFKLYIKTLVVILELKYYKICKIPIGNLYN